MAHAQDEKCCDFCRIGRIAKRSLQIAFRQDTTLGYVSCLADIPLGVATAAATRIGMKKQRPSPKTRFGANTSSFYLCNGDRPLPIQIACSFYPCSGARPLLIRLEALRGFGVIEGRTCSLVLSPAIMSSLILKRASASRSSGEWGDDDFDVLADGVWAS